MTPPDYKEKAAELWLDATPGREHACYNPQAVIKIATALTQADALGYARGRGELDKLLELLRREEFDAVAELYSRALTAEPAKPCEECGGDGVVLREIPEHLQAVGYSHPRGETHRPCPNGCQTAKEKP